MAEFEDNAKLLKLSAILVAGAEIPSAGSELDEKLPCDKESTTPTARARVDERVHLWA